MFGDYHYHYPSLLDLWRWQGVCRHCVNAVLRSSPMQRNFFSILLLQTPPYPSFLSSFAPWFLQINLFQQNNLRAQAGLFYKAKLYKGILLSCRSWAMVGNGMASSFFPLFRNLISTAVPSERWSANLVLKDSRKWFGIVATAIRHELDLLLPKNTKSKIWNLSLFLA